MGLVLDTLKIQNITDDVGYLNSIGRIQGARVRMDASVAEARAAADANAQQSLNWCASQIAKVDADLAIAQQETNKRVLDAQTRRAAMIAESEGQVLAQVAQVTAEIERQKARVLQVQRQLEADVVQPAEADCKAREEDGARRRRDRDRARQGRGRGAAQDCATAYAAAGPGAREVMALQQVIPLLAQVAGSGWPLVIGKVTVLPQDGDGGEVRKGRDPRVRADQGRDRCRPGGDDAEGAAAAEAAGALAALPCQPDNSVRTELLQQYLRSFAAAQPTWLFTAFRTAATAAARSSSLAVAR